MLMDSAGLEWGLKPCMSNQLPSDVAAAAGLWTMDSPWWTGRAMLLLFAIYPQLQAQT